MILEEQQDLKKNEKNEKQKVKEIPNEERARHLRSDFLLRTVAVSLEATAGVNTIDEEKGREGWELFHVAARLGIQ